MASARVLTTNELGIIRYQKAAIENQWPIEVRLLPQLNDTHATVYTLHTAGNLAIAFTPTKREELRATLSVPPGALVYEVLRDGLLVSTGGLEVRQPQPIPDFNHYYQQQQLQLGDSVDVNVVTSPVTTTSTTTTITTSSSSSSSSSSTSSSNALRNNTTATNDDIGTTYYNNDTDKIANHTHSHSHSHTHIPSNFQNNSSRTGAHLSGALQIPVHQGAYPDDNQRWPVLFQYNELSWTVRQVAVIDDASGAVKGTLSRNAGRDGFTGRMYLPPGAFHYRFKVIPDEALHLQIVSQPTCLGWDDGAMTHAWELMTWCLTVHVVDLSVSGVSVVDGLMRLEKLPKVTLTDISHINDDDDDDDDSDDDDEDEIVIRQSSVEIEEEKGQDEIGKGIVEGNRIRGIITNNNYVDMKLEDIQKNLNETRFGNEGKVDGNMEINSEDSLIRRFENTRIHGRETNVHEEDTMMDEESSSNATGNGEAFKEEADEEERKTSSTFVVVTAPTPTITKETCTADSNDIDPLNDDDDFSTSQVSENERSKKSLKLNEEQQLRSIINTNTSNSRKSRGNNGSSGGLTKMKKKKDKNHGWSGLAMNAVMFILGSTMTIMMGNAGHRRRRHGHEHDDDDSDSDRESTASRRPSYHRKSMNMDIDMDVESEILTDIGNQSDPDAQSDDVLFADRRKSYRKSKSFSARLSDKVSAQEDSDFVPFAQRRSSVRRSSK